MQNITGQMNSAPKQRTQAWLDQRKGRVTGSVAGAILGVNPHTSREDVLRRFVRDWHGAEPEFTGNIATRHGTAHEDGAIVDFQMETGIGVNPVGFLPYEDWLGASPDGLTDDGGVLEVKVPFGRRNDQFANFKPLADQPHYYAQVQIEILCAKASHGWLWQWSAYGFDLERVEIDHAWLDENLPRLKQFHAELMDAIATPDEYLAPRRVVIDTPAASKLLREYDEMADAEERASARRKAIIDELVHMAGNGDAEVCGRKLTRVDRAGSISYAKALAELAPGADLEKWRGKPSSSWRLS